MQDIYARMTGGSICPLYICIVLDLSVGLVIMQGIYALIDWEGPSAHRHWSGCNGIQGIYTLLTGGPSAFYIYALS